MKKILAITLALVFAFSGCITLAYADYKDGACTDCKAKFETESTYEAHKAEKTKKCEICSSEFATACEYEQHLIKKTVTCDVCNYEFKSDCEYAAHKAALKEAMVCVYCEKSFGTVCDYTQHLVTDLDGKGTACSEGHVLSCPFCDYQTKNETSYNNHIGKLCPVRYPAKPDTDKLYVCHFKDEKGNECGAIFTSEANLKDHQTRACIYRNIKGNTVEEPAKEKEPTTASTVLAKVMEILNKIMDKLGGIEGIVIKIIDLLGKAITAILGAVIK